MRWARWLPFILAGLITLLTLLILLVLLISVSGIVRAAPTIGLVSENKGNDCEIQRGKNKLVGVKGSSIEAMDAYITGACASAITFRDASQVRITEHSKLVIDDFVFDPSRSDAGKMAMKVTLGTVRFASGQIEKGNSQNVSIKTPTATIAVRGTDFTMTVDEIGQSLIVLLPSCKDARDVKRYEMEENKCKVGIIDVTTDAGLVTLDQAFHSTYISSSIVSPTPPVILNITEGKINNTLIIARPPEVQRAIANVAKALMEKNKEPGEIEAKPASGASDKKSTSSTTPQAGPQAETVSEAAAEHQAPPSIVQQMTHMTHMTNIAQITSTDIIKPLTVSITAIPGPCNAMENICVKWESSDGVSVGGKGIAYRGEAPVNHYAEIKTQGEVSNTKVSVTQNDSLSSYAFGESNGKSNVITITQNGIRTR